MFNLEFFIAKRYANSLTKKRNIINVISLVSVIAIAGGTMALVVMLSCFNGIENLVVSMLNVFDTPLKVEPIYGKHFVSDSAVLNKIYSIPEVSHVVEVIEENALAEYEQRQHIVRVKGVSSNYQTFTRLDSMILDGKLLLEEGATDYAVLGGGVWYNLGVNIRDFQTPLTLVAPKRSSGNILTANMFNQEYIFPSGVFSVQQEIDEKYVIVPLRFAKTLFDYDSLRSYYEIWTKSNDGAAKIKKQIENIVGDQFRVLDRYEQQKDIYKIMKTEKLAVFLIFTFILLVAAFNMISSIAMTIIDKQKDIYILNAMGFPLKKAKRIFLWQGMLQSVLGAATGIILGLTVCLLQQKFGFIPLSSEGGTFIIDYYPVKIVFLDIVMVFATIIIIGLATSLIPVMKITKTFIASSEK
jgi:ABC-type lipoprotein release transport system permease subunit